MFQFLFVLDLCNKDPPSFLETYFEGVPLLQCRVLWREPNFVRNFCCARPQSLWHQSHSAARCRQLHGILLYAMFCLLRLKDVLITTVHFHEFGKLDLNTFVVQAVYIRPFRKLRLVCWETWESLHA